VFQILDISDSSDSDADDGPMNTRIYRERINFALNGEEFRLRFRLSTAAAEWLLQQIGPALGENSGRTADLTPKQKLIVTLK
jgi:hypothetical protein